MNLYLLDETVVLGRRLLKDIASYYRAYLQHDMLENWKKRAEDHEYGGFITNFDRRWNITSYEKGGWAQSRCIFTFAYAYEVLDHDPRWLELARCGTEFVCNHMYDGKGRINHVTDRAGNVLVPADSIFSSAFAISGLSQYMIVSGDMRYLKILNLLYNQYEIDVMTNGFPGIAPYVAQSGLSHHAVSMIAVNTAYLASKILGQGRTNDLIDFCVDRILYQHLDETSGCILEKCLLPGAANLACDPIVNVGHTYECMWFLFEIARNKKDTDMQRRILSIVEETYRRVHAFGRELVFSFHLDDAEPTNPDFTNISWVYAEALCIYAYLTVFTGKQEYLQRFIRIHNLTQQYFLDLTYGDWFHALDKEMEVVQDFKGSLVKAPYHMARAFLKLIELFEAYSSDTNPM